METMDNEILQALSARKSVRVYTDEPVTEAERDAILQAVFQAPTAGNQQLYTILNITDPALKARLADLCDHQPFIAKAPLVLVFLADCRRWLQAYKAAGIEDVRTPGVGDLLLAMADTCIAAQNAVVAAESLGIGSCYIGDVIENAEQMREALHLPEHVVPACMLVFGRPTDQQKARPKPARFAKDAVVCENTYRDRTDELMLKGLFTTITNVNFNNETILQIKNDIEKEKAAVSTTHFADYDMAELWRAGEDVRSLKSLILFGLKGMAAYAYHARALGKTDPAVNRYFYEALAALGEEKSADDLLKLVLKTGEVNLACMALLDAANTEAYGDPVPVTVPLTIEKGPFIVVSGHDLHDLKLLLEQTEGKGINIYTHSEMLPAHGYPELKKYPHLKGNFGTGWQNQQTEFHNIPAPILFTTNCLMPVRQSYCDRVFTTSVVSYPEIPHIGADKDFTPVIEKALECGGYPDDHPMTGMNGGHTVTTGFARNAVLAHAGEIVQLVKSGKIRHIFLIGGCDGAAPSRSYYTDFARMTPADTLILTLACGKYRLNDMDLGSIGGIPRILDCGQCNDAYSAIRIAMALAEAFGCGVNDLPLTLVLSWYEQKAVCILLTLLYLGLQHIYLGPTIPAFVSPNVLQFLVENYHLTPTSDPKTDLKAILHE